MGQSKGRLAARFLIAPGQWENAVRDTLAAIERVHGDDWDWARVLPCVRVEWSSDAATKWVGDYTAPRRRYAFFGIWTEPRIRLATRDRFPRLTFAHEFAHLLDDTASGFHLLRVARKSATLFSEVVRLAQQSESYRKRDHTLGTGTLSEEQEKERAYFLRREEVWCEVYAQYIALRAGDEALMAEREAFQKWAPSRVWSEADFAPLADALDQIFRLGSAALIPNRR